MNIHAGNKPQLSLPKAEVIVVTVYHNVALPHEIISRQLVYSESA
jgi:hypothetical protein